jgi:hypothetical protein
MYFKLHSILQYISYQKTEVKENSLKHSSEDAMNHVQTLFFSVYIFLLFFLEKTQKKNKFKVEKKIKINGNRNEDENMYVYLHNPIICEYSLPR